MFVAYNVYSRFGLGYGCALNFIQRILVSTKKNHFKFSNNLVVKFLFLFCTNSFNFMMIVSTHNAGEADPTKTVTDWVPPPRSKGESFFFFFIETLRI